ncbi:MAG: hypothetical protein Q7R85_03840 [bacterium]|nr:hypothetical protein [bacterium]
MEDDEPKISQVESFIIISILAGLDVADIALLAFGLPDFFILDIFAFPLTQLYFRMKGVRANYALIGNLGELLPYIDKLPMRTIGAIATIRAANHPEGLVSEAVNIGGAVVRKKLQTAHKVSDATATESEGQLKVIRAAAGTTPSQAPSAEAQNAERLATEARRNADEAKEKFRNFEMLRQKAAIERNVSPEVPEEEQKEGNSDNVIRPPFGEEQGDSKEAA